MDVFGIIYDRIGFPPIMPYEVFGFNAWLVIPGGKRMNRYLKRRKHLCKR